MNVCFQSCTRQVSPGFTSRPSLSVAGSGLDARATPSVSPGFTSRPSLSEQLGRRDRPLSVGVAGIHVPAFVERRPRPTGTPAPASGVAGIHVPAFVERRCSAASTAGATPRVAGIHVPAFVERRRRARRARLRAGRVAGIHVPAFVERAACRSRRPACPACRRDSRPGLR